MLIPLILTVTDSHQGAPAGQSSKDRQKTIQQLLFVSKDIFSLDGITHFHLDLVCVLMVLIDGLL